MKFKTFNLYEIKNTFCSNAIFLSCSVFFMYSKHSKCFIIQTFVKYTNNQMPNSQQNKPYFDPQKTFHTSSLGLLNCIGVCGMLATLECRSLIWLRTARPHILSL